MSDPVPFHGVMISSTFSDLEEYRELVNETLRRYQMAPVPMETAPQRTDLDVLQSSLQMVHDAAAYLLVIGTKYGQIPLSPERNSGNLSLTELEYQEARLLGRPILVFIMGEEHPVLRKDFETDPVKQRKLDAFRERVKQGSGVDGVQRVYDEFHSRQQLLTVLGPALAALKKRLDAIPDTRIMEDGTDLPRRGPVPPHLGCNAEYLGGHPLVGRAELLQQIDRWAAPDDLAPVLLLEAIGGTGKSILTWEWLNRSAPQIRQDWAGRYWYSFYEAGAQMRDFVQRALAYMTGRPLKLLREHSTEELGDQLLALLQERPWLLVLDGVERLLVEYNRYNAAQWDDATAGTHGELDRRAPTALIRDDDDALFRRLLTVRPSKILMTSRLLPHCFVNSTGRALPGLRAVLLPGLKPDEAETMMRACGVDGSGPLMQQWLQTNCGCHPLVIGVVAGQINHYLPARGDFDAWVHDPAGGLALNFAQVPLNQRRNNILEAAFLGLSADAQDLLASFALLTRSFDHKVVFALAPKHAGAKHDKLAELIMDLEQRGFLLYDRQRRLYDLHPVVRGVVSGRMADADKARLGEKVIDHFSSAAPPNWDQVTSLDDVQSALQVVQTWLAMGKLAQAYATLMAGLYDALRLNLEVADTLLELFRPFFAQDWVRLAPGVPDEIEVDLRHAAGIALYAVGLTDEALFNYTASADIYAKNDQLPFLFGSLSTIAFSLRERGSLALAQAVLEREFSLADAGCNNSDWFYAHLRGLPMACELGQSDTFAYHWQHYLFSDGMWHIKQYRPGTAEFWLVRHRFEQGELCEADLAAAEALANSAKGSRYVRRQLACLRGEWALWSGDHELAMASLGKAARMARECGRRDAQAESLLALAHFRQVDDWGQAYREALRLSEEKVKADLELAYLWDALGRHERAIEHARKAWISARADGEPHVFRYRLQQAEKLLLHLGQAVPNDAAMPLGISGACKLAIERLLVKVDAQVATLLVKNADQIERNRKRSLFDREIAMKGHLIHKLKAKDTTGRWAYYFVLVNPDKEKAFLNAIEGTGTTDLEDYGKMVASCYGEEPTHEVRAYLREKYDFDV